MLRLRVVALASGLPFLVLGAVSANAQVVYPPPEQQPAQTPPPAIEVEVNPEVEVQTPPQAPLPAPNIEIHTPPPTVVQEPAPVYVDERPIVVVEPRSRNMALSLGGGISNFFSETLQSRTSMQGAYEARVAFGTRSMIGLEAAYVGTAGAIDALGLDDSAVLLSNGVEGLMRINVGTYDIQPFLVGGASWVRYSVVNDNFNTSDVRDSDDVLAVPLGAGLATYLGDTGLMLDGRFIYRHTFDDELLRPTPNNSGGAALHNWLATLRLGYTF